MPTSPFAFLQPTARALSTSASPATGLPAGTKVGGWQIAGAPHPLGDRTRHAAVQLDGERREAVLEVFEAPALPSGAYATRLRELVAAVGRVDHPGALKLFDAGTLGDGRPYIVREALDGYTLAELRADSPLPPRAVINVVRGICEVLAAAHAAGVAHGAIDLDHVLARETDDAVVLLDWRVVAVIREEAQRRGRLARGSSAHMSQADCSGEDIRALGAIIRALSGGMMPIALGSLATVMCAEDPRTRPSIAEVVARLCVIDDELDIDAVHACELPPQLRTPGFLMTRTWRAVSLALACAAPIAFLAWREQRPVAAAAEVAPVAEMAAPAPSAESIAPPAVTARAYEEAVPEPVEVAIAPPAPPVAAMTVARAPAPEVQPTVDAALLQQYQRVGHDLYALENQIGVAAAADVRAAFREIHVDELATGADAAAALTDVAQRIERLRPVQVSDDCKNNPLASECE